MERARNLADKLKDVGLSMEAVDYASRGYHYEVRMESGQVRELAGALLEFGFFLEFVTAVHVTPSIEVIYQYAHFDIPCRISAKAPVTEAGTVPTISDIYQGALWHERETRDFYGVVFEGHENLTPLLLADEDKDLKPLLKSDKKLKSVEEISWGFEKAKKGKAVKNLDEEKVKKSAAK